MGEHYLSFDKLNEQVTIQQVAERMLGLHLKLLGGELRGCCPISQSSDPRHFVVFLAKNRYVCFCPECQRYSKRGGDAIELVRRLRRFDSPLPAAKAIAEHFGLNFTTPSQERQPQPSQEESARFDPLVYQNGLQPEHEALAGCGVTTDTIRAWGGGYSAVGALGGRLSLPLCNIDGKITGFVGIALKGDTPDLKFSKGIVVPFFFGLHMLTEEKDLHMVFHPLDALRYHEDGIQNVVALLTPITRDVLTSLIGLMDAKGIIGVEFH